MSKTYSILKTIQFDNLQFIFHQICFHADARESTPEWAEAAERKKKVVKRRLPKLEKHKGRICRFARSEQKEPKIVA